MTHCEAEVFTKVLEGEDALSKATKLLEGLRSHHFQAVIWEKDKYMGGTWFNPIQGKWTAEFLEMSWDTENTAQEIVREVQKKEAERNTPR